MSNKNVHSFSSHVSDSGNTENHFLVVYKRDDLLSNPLLDSDESVNLRAVRDAESVAETRSLQMVKSKTPDELEEMEFVEEYSSSDFDLLDTELEQLEKGDEESEFYIIIKQNNYYEEEE